MKNVLLIDSGSGGLNVLKECVKIVPFCNFLFFCDNKNLPYGNKSKAELEEITIKNLKKIYCFFKFDIVVFACNTLTCTCIEKCREIFTDKIFVGTVPAIKPALAEFEEKDILVLATKVTIEHNVSLGKAKNVKKISMQTLAEDIDKNLDNLAVLRDRLMLEFANEKCKALVLGCTHYIALKDVFYDVFAGDIKIFDSANGVARRLKSFVESENQIQNKNFKVQIMVSGDENFLGKLWWYYYKK